MRKNERPEVFEIWNYAGVRNGNHGHLAVVWLSSKLGWCGEARFYKISIKKCTTREEVKAKVDAALIAAGCDLDQPA
jgi:hypothetical protein